VSNPLIEQDLSSSSFTFFSCTYSSCPTPSPPPLLCSTSSHPVHSLEQFELPPHARHPTVALLWSALRHVHVHGVRTKRLEAIRPKTLKRPKLLRRPVVLSCVACTNEKEYTKSLIMLVSSDGNARLSENMSTQSVQKQFRLQLLASLLLRKLIG
jgi:hypothetical protein